MKPLLMLVVIAAIGGLVFSMVNDLRPGHAKAKPGLQPLLYCAGTVAQHHTAGMLVRGRTRPAGAGNDRGETGGLFYLVGFPWQKATADGQAIVFAARANGVYTYPAVGGVTNTVTRIDYDPAEVPVEVTAAAPALPRATRR